MANVITYEAGLWLNYQLRLNGLHQKTVAREADCSVGMVSQFLRGEKDSKRVRMALCKVLGGRSVKDLLARMPHTWKGGTA